MPDSRTSCDTPRGWDDAFAALPLEAPSADTWTSIARRLPRRPPDSRRAHRPYWLAMAAAVTLAAVVPVFRWTGNETPPVTKSAATASTIASSTSIATALPISPDAAPAVSRAAADRSPPIAPLLTPENSASSISTAAAASTAPPAAKRTRSRKDMPTQPEGSAIRATAIAEQHGRLESLYAESARLEAVLARLQEPRVASATAAALSAELQDRIVDIDGALSQADVPSTSQLALWQQRVDALRQLTGVETTQRWMAAQGATTEQSLAQVY